MNIEDKKIKNILDYSSCRSIISQFHPAYPAHPVHPVKIKNRI